MPDERTSITYLDFEIEIGLGQGREYPVAVRSPAGEARGVMCFPFSDLQLEICLLNLENALLRSGGPKRRQLTQEQVVVRDFGQALFNALLTGDGRGRYEVSKMQARQQGKGLRLKLRIQPPELAVLPWEYLFDSNEREYLCLSSQTPVVRYVEIPQPLLPLAIQPPLRILAMCASPAGLPELDIAREMERLNQATAALQRDSLLQITWLSGGRDDLQRALRRDGPWHIFHFIGHGRFDRLGGEGQLALVDEDGGPQLLNAAALARLLGNHPALRLVFLNACEGAQTSAEDPFSSLATALMGRGLPAVIAMQREITDRAAIKLSQIFYESLVDGLPVDAAVNEARIAVSMAVNNTLEWGTPVLYMRAVDGVLFSVQPPVDGGQKKKEAGEHRLEDTGQQSVGEPPTVVEQKKKPAKAVASQRKPKPKAKVPDPNLLTVTLASNVTMDFVRIPAGEFLMGSDKGKDVEAWEDELPQHRVELPEYWLAKTPISNVQYRTFVQASGHRKPQHWEDGKIPQGKEQHPVVHVSWEDAAAFCEWASQISGKIISLPTEAQWEKAARGMDGLIFPWGNQVPDANLCNYGMNVKDTTPVGQYSPQGDSPYGCMDVAGNVWEWTSSIFRSYPFRKDDGRENAKSRDRRVMRGGAWVDYSRSVRCSKRYRIALSFFSDSVGFRPALSFFDADSRQSTAEQQSAVSEQRFERTPESKVKAAQAAFVMEKPTTRKPKRQPAAKPADPDLLTISLAPGVTMDFVRIPAGEFLMGSDNKKDAQAEDSEVPQHSVDLAEYWMAKTPVTNAQYSTFVQANKRAAPQRWLGGKIPHGKEQHPVVYVSWEDAAAFCAWASQASGQKIALPSEAQWEKATRGTDGRIYPWGDRRPDVNRCNFGYNVRDTTPVGQYSPQGDSPYGCVDMAGNVWEWCADWFDENEYSRRGKIMVTDPNGPSSGQYRVLRGGSWYDIAVSYLRAAYRNWGNPSDRSDDSGFRCSHSP